MHGWVSLIHAIVFDLDDTLYPERQYAFSGFAAVAVAFADRLGEPDRAAADMRRLFDGAHRPRVFNRLLAERGLNEDPDLVRSMINTFRTHDPVISLYPDADAALMRLRGGHKLGLISDGLAIVQRAKVEALELAPRLDAILLTDELGSGFGKPHPRAFEWMRERLGVDHRSCVYVADNAAKDFLAPLALGWTTVQVFRPNGIYRETPPAPHGAARHVIESLEELDAIL